MYSLTPAEHLAVIRTTVMAAEGKVPVIAGVGFGQQLAVELAKAAEDVGADGILAFPPYYPQADDEGMFEYYRAIGRATRLGMLIYSRDWASFSPAMVERLTSIPTLVAWKDGQGDIRRLQMIMNRVGDRLHWIGGAGDDMVAAYYSTGIRTYTSSIATVAPRLSLELHELAANGRTEMLMTLMHKLCDRLIIRSHQIACRPRPPIYVFTCEQAFAQVQLFDHFIRGVGDPDDIFQVALKLPPLPREWIQIMLHVQATIRFQAFEHAKLIEMIEQFKRFEALIDLLAVLLDPREVPGHLGLIVLVIAHGANDLGGFFAKCP